MDPNFSIFLVFILLNFEYQNFKKFNTFSTIGINIKKPSQVTPYSLCHLQ
jgi:type IV secretory pathway TrbL component